MLLNKNLAGSEKPKKSLGKKAVSFITSALTRGKKQEAPKVEPEISIPEIANQSMVAKTLEQVKTLSLKGQPIDWNHLDPIGQEVSQPNVQTYNQPGFQEHKELTKDIHRADIQHLDESRAVAMLKADINKLLSIDSEVLQSVIESDLIPAMVEDFGMGVVSATNIANMYSNWNEQNKLNNTFRVLEKLIQNKEPEDREKPMSRSMTVHVREYGKKIEKTDNTAIYEELRTQLLKQKFISNFSPEVKRIIIENLLPELIDQGFTETELFALEKEELKYHLYQVLSELIKFNEINVRQEKLDLAQHALMSKFNPGKIPFGQQ